MDAPTDIDLKQSKALSGIPLRGVHHLALTTDDLKLTTECTRYATCSRNESSRRNRDKGKSWKPAL